MHALSRFRISLMYRSRWTLLVAGRLALGISSSRRRPSWSSRSIFSRSDPVCPAALATLCALLMAGGAHSSEFATGQPRSPRKFSGQDIKSGKTRRDGSGRRCGDGALTPRMFISRQYPETSGNSPKPPLTLYRRDRHPPRKPETKTERRVMTVAETAAVRQSRGGRRRSTCCLRSTALLKSSSQGAAKRGVQGAHLDPLGLLIAPAAHCIKSQIEREGGRD